MVERKNGELWRHLWLGRENGVLILPPTPLVETQQTHLWNSKLDQRDFQESMTYRANHIKDDSDNVKTIRNWLVSCLERGLEMILMIWQKKMLHVIMIFKENIQYKFRTFISEISSFVGNPVDSFYYLQNVVNKSSWCHKNYIALSRLLCCDFFLKICVFLLQLLSSLNIDIYELKFFDICPSKTQKQPWNLNIIFNQILKSNISYIHKMLKQTCN